MAYLSVALFFVSVLLFGRGALLLSGGASESGGDEHGAGADLAAAEASKSNDTSSRSAVFTIGLSILLFCVSLVAFGVDYVQPTWRSDFLAPGAPVSVEFSYLVRRHFIPVAPRPHLAPRPFIPVAPKPNVAPRQNSRILRVKIIGAPSFHTCCAEAKSPNTAREDHTCRIMFVVPST